MVHIKKEKGDDAVARVITDLTIKRYYIFIPVITEHLPFDLIAYKDNKSFRIQAKYSSSGTIQNKTSWTDKNKTHHRFYDENDFDYYAIYIPQIDKIVYPSINFGGCRITHLIPNSPTPFYWYEDFLDFTNQASKKTYRDFNKSIMRPPTELTITSSIKRRIVDRPSKEDLFNLLWTMPTSQIAKQFNVSDKCIEKWSKSYGLNKPPRGYWAKHLCNS